MGSHNLPVLLVTANVGSVFEDPINMLPIWTDEFLDTISRLEPSFIALHLQEVGGKTYEKSMENVQEFVQTLCKASQMKSYDSVRVFLDEDFSSAEHFTALGNLYFVNKTVKSSKIWDFTTQKWVQADGVSIHTGNIENVPTKDKSKFPQHFFPECKWSRKGFLRTRWCLNGTVLDLVNIHLFHDASNLAASEAFPSVYCKSRRRALQHTLERFHQDTLNGTAPYFVFGDFNFRCDTQGIVEKLTENLTATRLQSSKTNDLSKVQYKDTDGQVVLTVGKKEFSHSHHQSVFREDWVRKYDKEMQSLQPFLFEFPIVFPPSYPYEEDVSLGENFMKTRCPSWCDRVLLSQAAMELISRGGSDAKGGKEMGGSDKPRTTDVVYGVIGERTCMGDHKPVYLQAWMKPDQGTIRCCEHENAPKFCFVLPNSIAPNFNRNSLVVGSSVCITNGNDSYKELITELNKNTVRINVIDTDVNLNVCLCDFWQGTETSYTPNICAKCGKFKTKNSGYLKTRNNTSNQFDKDIIVNSIDTQFLCTLEHEYQDPYTPESLESHSPVLEPESENDTASDVLLEELNLNESQIVEKNKPNSVTEISLKAKFAMANRCDSTLSKAQGVSPRQLKSRLENILRASENNRSDNKRRSCCSCTIL